MYQREITPTPPKRIICDGHVAYDNVSFKAQATETLEGTVIAYNTVDEVYEPYVAGGSNGLGVPEYILDERIAADNNATPETVPVRVIWHGRVIDKNITCNGAAGADATTKEALKHIKFDDKIE